MRINTNIMALNAWRNLVLNTEAMQKSVERLSSGYRINRAADDAAGLAIVQKMAAQIRGLAMAQRNAQDAISLVQTAEGALNEVQGLLQRLRELALQASNDSATLSDRWQIQQEVNQLVRELNRIAVDTEFNTKKLLDGSFSGTFQIGANAGQTIQVAISDMRASVLGVVQTSADVKYDVGTTSLKVSGNTPLTDLSALRTGVYSIEIVDTGTQYKVNIRAEDGTVIGTADVPYGNAEPANGEQSVTVTISNTNYLVNPNNNQVAVVLRDINAADNRLTVGTGTAKAYVLQAGEGLSVLSQASASAAVTRFDSAIERVSAQRAQLGAVQNRLEHTINYLKAAQENLQAAESRIKDTDMALEMANFVRTQILQQASAAMLAQANVVPQVVLQLLGR